MSVFAIATSRFQAGNLLILPLEGVPAKPGREVVLPLEGVPAGRGREDILVYKKPPKRVVFLFGVLINDHYVRNYAHFVLTIFDDLDAGFWHNFVLQQRVQV